MATRSINERNREVKDAFSRSSGQGHEMPGQATILVVDDEEAMRDSCCQALAVDGYRTETAEDGDSGLQKLREIKPDLVLVDLKMPGMNGMELLEKIRDVDPNIVSVVITGYPTRESAVEARKRNAYDFLPKPFTPDQLRIIVKRGLAQFIKGKKMETELIDEKKRTAKLIDGKAVAQRVKEELKKEIVELEAKHQSSPLLLAVQVGENPASASYLKSQKRGCEEVGINYQVQQLPREISESELIQFIQEKNQDGRTTGIILQMPLPQQIDAEKVQEAIDPSKDVEGVNPQNMGLLFYGWPGLVPCTALAVMELIKSTGTSIKGKQVTLVGHSALVGKPLALLLLSSEFDSATTTVCHIATQDLAAHTKRAEILIVAVGKPGLIKGDMIREGAIVIDVGINRVDGKIVGDVIFDEAKEKASLITPVPGGVGPVTTTMLLKNTVEAWKIQLGFDFRADIKWRMD
ncbi:MAG TPA: tetrahydrofolate dehydrogenase/cyclohydrolase catalytic domain-containing protein [Sedimentisphaerales bacterium]|nr:tetrahydrofolate dehydrogenase/cyclohydrolase catalytic domain-containing protein [Sedimentisphaerales bacterium]